MSHVDNVINSVVANYDSGLDVMYKQATTAGLHSLQVTALIARLHAYTVWSKEAQQWQLPPNGLHILDKFGGTKPLVPVTASRVIFPPFARNVLQWADVTREGEKSADVIGIFSQLDGDTIKMLDAMRARPCNKEGASVYTSIKTSADYNGWMFLTVGLLAKSEEKNVSVPPSVGIIFHQSALAFVVEHKDDKLGTLELDTEKVVILLLDQSRPMRLDDNLTLDGVEWVMSVLWVVIDFCLTLASTNVKRRLVKPPEKLNKKRIRNGKPPYSEFYVIDIEDPVDKSTSASRQLHDENDETTHRRLHTRRQHIRTYKNGTWTLVRAHEVGRKDLGTIIKGYRIPT